MSKLLVIATAALGIAGATPLHAQTAGPHATSAAAPTLKTLDPSRRAWFEHAVADILTDCDRQADRAGVLQGRSSGR